MKCDFDTFKVSLFSVSHVDIFVNSEFRILMVDSMLSPSMKILVSSANKIEIDYLLCELRQINVGCHMNGYFVGGVIYADGITLLCPTRSSILSMLNVCDVGSYTIIL